MKKLFLISSNAGATEFYFNKDDIEKVYKTMAKKMKL